MAVKEKKTKVANADIDMAKEEKVKDTADKKSKKAKKTLNLEQTEMDNNIKNTGILQNAGTSGNFDLDTKGTSADEDTKLKKDDKSESILKTKKNKLNEKMVLQYLGQEYDIEDIKNRVKQAYTLAGNPEKEIKEFEVYLKPEENAVYYVINGMPQGKIVLS